MTTTCVRDSIVGDAWIMATAQAVPIQPIIDEKTGQPTGDFLTGPVRLAFDNLFELPQPTKDVPNPKYGTAMLFTPYADFTPMYQAYYDVCGREFADYYDPQSGQYNGLYSPFRDQREKTKFGGFTPGCIFLTATSKFKPPIVDAFRNPIVDRSKVYPGVWAICAVNPYSFKDARKKGVAFGLQSVMIIGDDTKFGGGAPDPNKTFGGVKGLAAPIIRPEQLQGMPRPAAPAPVAGIPGYTQPGFSPPSNGGFAGAARAVPPAMMGNVGTAVPHVNSASTYTGSAGVPMSNPQFAPPAAAPYMPPQMPGVPLNNSEDDDIMRSLGM